MDLLKYKKNLTPTQFLEKQNLYFQWVAVLVIFMLILVYGVYGPEFNPLQFIYFQF